MTASEMDMLSGFDLGATDHTPNAFKYNDITSEQMQLFNQLEETLSARTSVCGSYSLCRLTRSSMGPDTLRQPGAFLPLAVESENKDTAQYILAEGVQIFATHVKIAVTTRARPITQLLLQHGWSINQRLGWSDPPALAQVQ